MFKKFVQFSPLLALLLVVTTYTGCKSEKAAAVVKPTKKVAASLPVAPEFKHEHFEAPFRLMVDNDPLNNAAKQMYPSPAMFDVDNDGQAELIVGDIFGSLNVYENKNSDPGDPVWSKHYPLNSADGEKIKVSNW